MKNKLYIPIFATLALGFSACESDIDNYMVDDTVGLLNSGLVETQVFPGVDDVYEVYAIKAGKGFNSADVNLVVDPTIITEYNALTTTKQTVSELPADCYSITVSSLVLTNEDYRKPFVITWNIDKLEAALAQDPNQVVPLRMNVETDGKIATDRLTAMVQPSVAKPAVALQQTGLYTGLEPTRASHTEQLVYFNVSSNFIAQEDINYEVIIDPTLLEDYNTSNNKNYTLLPEDAYEIDTEGTIKQHLSSDMFKMTFFREAIIPTDGPSKFGEYILPIRIKLENETMEDEAQNYVLYTISVKAVEISKLGWSVIDCSSDVNDDPKATEKEKTAYAPSNIIDGDNSTYWRTQFNSQQPIPHYITIDLGRDRDLYKMRFNAPQKSADRGFVNNKTGYVEASADGETWTKIADWSTPSRTTYSCEFEVTPATARYIKFVVSEVWQDPLTEKKNGKFVSYFNSTAVSEITIMGE